MLKSSTIFVSDAPPRPPLRHIVLASIAISLPLMALALLATSLSDLLFIPPIGAAMALIVGAPSLPLAQPRNVVVGHFIGCISGIATLHLFGSSVVSSAVAAGVAFALMLFARSAHSPATATAMVTVLMPHGDDLSFIGFIIASSILIVLLGLAANRLRGLKYPAYWW